MKNINLDKLKKGVFSLAIGAVIGASAVACGSDKKNDSDIPVIEFSTETNNDKGKNETSKVEIENVLSEAIKNENGIVGESTEKETKEDTVVEETIESVEKEEVETPVVEEVVITELNVEDFNKLVEKVEKANMESGLNLRKENLELVVYINNINIATPELVQKIESAYNYNEEDMINVYLQTMTAYNNDKLEYYNGEDDKYADESVMFTDKIDRETIKYIDTLFEGLYSNISNGLKGSLTKTKFDEMVDSVMARNAELGIGLTRQEIETAVYKTNTKYATVEVEEYVKSNLPNGQTIDNVNNYVTLAYNTFNKQSKTDFELSSLDFESYYIGNVVKELEGYTRENNTINGYTKDQLTVGGLFTAKMKIDDAFAYFATTGYANKYKNNISAIAEANMDACISRTYAILGSKAALVNCEEEKTLSHTK